MTQPDYTKMSLKELRKYVLTHREDKEAWREYADRPRNSVKFPPNQNFNSENKTPPDAVQQIIETVIKNQETSN